MRSKILSSQVLLAIVISASSTVKLPNGIFQGYSDGFTVSYLGIPYAAPPTGNLRFKPPTKPLQQNGTNLAIAFGPRCMQNSGNEYEMSEDCLSINVFSPARKTNLPVIVYIYGGSIMGGAFDSGFTSDRYYDARRLLDVNPNVVVVTFNYRVGVFGFLGGVDLAADGPLNPGLLDQVAAFEWVHDNIHLFGGNASRVTAMGHSAGATSIGVHLLAGGGNQTLFSRAILLSGGPGMLYQTPESYDPAYQFLLTSLGCSPGTTSVACLRDKPAEILTNYTKNMEFFPIVDGNYVATQGLVSQLKLNAISKIPLLITNVQDEGSIASAILNITTDVDANMYRNSFFPYLNAAEQDQLSFIFPDSDYSLGAYEKAGAFYADFIYKCPAILLAELTNQNHIEIYKGTFTKAPQRSMYHVRYHPRVLGVHHASELPYIFQYHQSLGWRDKEFARKLLEQLVNFASGQSPATDWPTFGDTGRTIDMLTRKVHVWKNNTVKCNMLLNSALANFNCF